jgi:hypothetical protein
MNEKEERRFARQLEMIERRQERLERQKLKLRTRFNASKEDERRVKDKYNDGIKHHR